MLYLTPLNIYLLGCLVALPVVSKAIKAIQKERYVHPVSLGLAIIMSTASSWVMVGFYIIPRIYLTIKDLSKRTFLIVIEYLIRKKLKQLDFNIDKLGVKEQEFAKRLQNFTVDLLVNKTDAFDNETTRYAITEFIERCLQVKFTTPKETLDQLNYMQFTIFMKYIENLIKEHPLKQK